MTDFSLIKQIKNPETTKKPDAPYPPDYTEHAVSTYDAGQMTVYLPESTSVLFATAIQDLRAKTVVTEEDVKNTARAFRGIIGRK